MSSRPFELDFVNRFDFDRGREEKKASPRQSKNIEISSVLLSITSYFRAKKKERDIKPPNSAHFSGKTAAFSAYPPLPNNGVLSSNDK